MACEDTQQAPQYHSKLFAKLHGVLTQTTLWILITLSTSSPVPKNINNWSMDGNVTFEKPNYTGTVCCLQTRYFNAIYFSHQLHTHSVSYFACQTNWRNEIKKTSWLQTLSVQIHTLGSGTHIITWQTTTHSKQNTTQIANMVKSDLLNYILA